MTRAGDVGAADPELAKALATGDVAAVRSAMLRARLIVPLIARGEESTNVEMTVPLLVGNDGRHALPVFSSVDALRAWRPAARPVPVTGAEVFVAARDEGYGAVVLDVAGPACHVVETADVVVLAASRPLHPGS